MSDVGIFIAGSVVFVFTTWAVIAFGLARFQELYRTDMADADGVVGVIEDRFTEVYVRK